MPSYATPIALFLYLLPIALVVVLRSSRERAAWEIALDIPAAVAVDLIVIQALARVVTVETAIVISRPLWLVGIVAWWIVRHRRGHRIAWPRAIKPMHVALILLVVWGSVLLSLELSRPKMMWDREWHMPLATSLRGQSIPFHNVFEPTAQLHYHLTGNILATELEVLSFDVMTAALALSLVHDVMFALTALVIGLAAVHFSGGRRAAILIAPLFFIVGPFTFRGVIGDSTRGYSFHNFLSLSFRPHVPLSGLLMVGFAIAVLARLHEEKPPLVRQTLPPLLLITAVLGLTDESATGLLSLSLGVAWLLYPNVVAPKRLVGVACFFGLAAAFIVPNIAFSAALALGGPLQKLAFVPLRNPGFQHEAILLSAPKGGLVLLSDVGPFVMSLIGLIIAFLFPLSRRKGAIIVFALVLCGVSIFALTKLEINAQADTVQRFMVAPMLVTPLLGALALDGKWSGSVARAFVLVGMAGGAGSTLFWFREDVPRTGTAPAAYNPHGYDLYDVDCRRVAGAHFGEVASRAYVDGSQYHLYVGCRPVYVPGGERGREHWQMKIFPDASLSGFALFDKEAGYSPLRVVCSVQPSGDPVCSRIVDRSACTPAGTAFVECMLSHAERGVFVGRTE